MVSNVNAKLITRLVPPILLVSGIKRPAAPKQRIEIEFRNESANGESWYSRSSSGNSGLIITSPARMFIAANRIGNMPVRAEFPDFTGVDTLAV